jgi:5'(3')-deoxyribonucleotidase
MKSKRVIAVDVDDVLAAEAEFIIAYGNKHWGHTLTVDEYQENWAAMWGVDIDELERRAAELHRPGLLTSYRLIDGAKEALQTLKKRYDLVILTSRRQVVKEETMAWLNDVFGGVFREVHFTGFWDTISAESHLLTKGELAKQIGAEYLIDDQPKHCVAAAEAGVQSLLFGDYYAEVRNITLPPKVTRCKDWSEVLEFFDGQRD